MSGGSHHPYTSQPNQHNSYFSHTSASDHHHHANPAFYNDPGAYPFHQHGNGSHFSGNFDPSSLAQHPSHFPQHNNDYSNQPEFQGGNNQFGHHYQPSPQQYNYPVTSGFHSHAVQAGAGLDNLLPNFDSTGSNFPNQTTHQPLSHNSAQYLQPGQWQQQQHYSGTPASIENFAQSLSPQPAYTLNQHNQHNQHNHQQQQQNFPSASAQSEAARLPLKQEDDLDSVSTPPLHSFDSTNSSPQKKQLRIKLKKRTVNIHETSSGGQQAQAQLQIEPPSNNMVGGRPSRAAAAAASANINNVYSDSPNSRSLRGRQVKQQPGSEEDYEEVSASQQPTTPPLQRHNEQNDDRDDDDGEQEESEDKDQEGDDSFEQQRTKKHRQRAQTSQSKQRMHQANSKGKGKRKEATAIAPSRSTRATSNGNRDARSVSSTRVTRGASRDKDVRQASSERRLNDRARSNKVESSSAARSNRAKSQPSQKGKAKPKVTYQAATRRSSRLLGGSQPDSSQEPSDARAYSHGLTVEIGIRQRMKEQNEMSGRQSVSLSFETRESCILGGKQSGDHGVRRGLRRNRTAGNCHHLAGILALSRV